MRSIWSGAISFGLIYIPVQLYNASQSEELDLDLLRRGDLCPIRYARVCRETGEEVPYEDIVKGFQYEKGEYVVLEDEDFRRANVKKTQTIEIMTFIDAAEVDQKMLEKPYYLEPGKGKGKSGAARVYALLREAMRKSKKVGVARFVLRTRERLAILKAEGDALVLNQMRFAQELRSPDDLDLPKDEEVSGRELNMAVRLIDELSEPWQPDQYRDTYIDDLKRIIQEKVEGREPAPAEEEEIPEEVTDLFARLSASLDQAREKNAARR